jgi:hypothetical protein
MHRVAHGGYAFFREAAPRIAEAVGEGDAPILTRGAIHLNLPERYWFYNTEDLHHPAKRNAHYMAILDRAERVFDYSEPNLRVYPRAEFAPIRLGKVMPAPAPAACDVEVLFFGTLSLRRRVITEAVEATTILGVHGDALAGWIRRSKIVLSLGTHDNVNNDSFRVFPALEYGARLVVESCQEEWFNRLVARYATVVAYKDLVMTCQEMIESLS